MQELPTSDPENISVSRMIAGPTRRPAQAPKKVLMIPEKSLKKRKLSMNKKPRVLAIKVNQMKVLCVNVYDHAFSLNDQEI